MPRNLSPETRALDAQRATAWNKANTRRVALSLNIRTDAALIAHLEQQPSIQGYIKQLIKSDMEAKNMLTGTIHSEKGFAICDPAYTLAPETFRATCSPNEYKSGEYKLNGSAFAFTACDDGAYRTVIVDSGSLGIVPLELCDHPDFEKNKSLCFIIEQPGDTAYIFSNDCAIFVLPDGEKHIFYM